MTLRVWSRVHCRWVRWRGTLKAWKLLPHAVVTATCTVAVGSVAWRAIQVDRPTLPVIAPLDTPMPYSAQPKIEGTIGYLNPWRSFEVDDTPPWPGGVYVVPRCETKQDHDRDDCKRVRTVPEPATWALMLSGLLLVSAAFMMRRASRYGRAGKPVACGRYPTEMTDDMRELAVINASIAAANGPVSGRDFAGHGIGWSPSFQSLPLTAIYVDACKGDDLTGDGSLDKPYKSIYRAMRVGPEYEI